MGESVCVKDLACRRSAPATSLVNRGLDLQTAKREEKDKYAKGRLITLPAICRSVVRALAMKRAKVALARKLGVVLHRMWVDATDFRWSAGPMAA